MDSCSVPNKADEDIHDDDCGRLYDCETPCDAASLCVVLARGEDVSAKVHRPNEMDGRGKL
jgi:hypothetical protein